MDHWLLLFSFSEHRAPDGSHVVVMQFLDFCSLRPSPLLLEKSLFGVLEEASCCMRSFVEVAVGKLNDLLSNFREFLL